MKIEDLRINQKVWLGERVFYVHTLKRANQPNENYIVELSSEFGSREITTSVWVSELSDKAPKKKVKREIVLWSSAQALKDIVLAKYTSINLSKIDHGYLVPVKITFEEEV